MLREFAFELNIANLEAQPLKLQWMGNKHVSKDAVIMFDGVVVERVEEMEILGCMVSCSGDEETTMRHRAKQSYKVFWKWQKVLTCRTTSIVKRLAFWNKTVAMSLTWGLETTRSSKTNHKILQQTQRMQVVKMMGLKRKNMMVEFWKSGLSGILEDSMRPSD